MDGIESPLAPKHIIYRRKPPISKYLVLFLVVAAITNAALAGFVYYKNVLTAKSDEQIACTTDAKLCPDGSSVGRTGPKCEFADCPKLNPLEELNSEKAKQILPLNETANWKTYRDYNLGFEFRYPANWIEKDLCDTEPFCIYSNQYDELPWEKDYKPEGMGGQEIQTKEDFTDFLALIKSKKLPAGYLADWQFIKVGGINAIQNYYYNVPGGIYQIETLIVTDKMILTVFVSLPVEPVYKQNATRKDYKEIDISKSEVKLIDIRNGLVDKDTKNVIDQYNLLLSTFKFLNSTSPTSSPLYR